MPGRFFPVNCTMTYFPNDKVCFIVGGGLSPQLPVSECSTWKAVYSFSCLDQIKDWSGRTITMNRCKDLKHKRYGHAACAISFDETDVQKQYLLIAGGAHPEAHKSVELYWCCTQVKFVLPQLTEARTGGHAAISMKGATGQLTRCYVFGGDTIEFLEVDNAWKTSKTAQKEWI